MWINYIKDFLSNIGINNVLDLIKAIIDISAVSVLIYWLIISLKNTRAYQLLKGVIVFVFIAVISQVLGLRTISYILANAMTYGVLLILVVFQPELRKTLETLGKRSLTDILVNEQSNSLEHDAEKVINEVCRAADTLSTTYTGALIVFERDVKLGDIIKTGTMLNSDISGELLVNIFTPNTPLHDGAVIISGGKIISAGCILPLTENNELSKELGTRHRAGIGITETSDSLVIIISEETGQISIAIDSGLTRNIDILTLKAVLNKVLKMDTKRNLKINSWKVKKGEKIG